MSLFKNISLILLFTIIFAFLIPFCHTSYCMEQDASQDSLNASESQYVPNEVIVKFKGNIDPQALLPQIIPDATDVSRLHSIKPIVSEFKKDYTLETLLKIGQKYA